MNTSADYDSISIPEAFKIVEQFKDKTRIGYLPTYTYHKNSNMTPEMLSAFMDKIIISLNYVVKK